MSDSLSIDALKKAYEQAARIVALHGETYLPLFERLEKEYRQRKKNADVLKRALMIANDSAD